MREHPYTGPRETAAFSDLSPDEAVRLLESYRLLGEAFEGSDDEDMDGRGWLIEDPLELVRDRSERLAKAERELTAAVQLARQRGTGWAEIDGALGVRSRLLKAQLEPPANPANG